MPKQGATEGAENAPATGAAKVIETDALIIGAGPAGLFAVFELGMHGLSAHVLDALPQIGGQCTELYPDKPIYDIPGFPRITGAALIARLKEQAGLFDPVYHLRTRALGHETLEDGRHAVTTDTGLRFIAPVVVIAAGGGVLEPKRPPIPGLAAYEGRSVFYAVRDREQFRDKDLVIAGGGDSALDWAIELAPLARRLVLLHRRETFRAAPESVRRMREMVKTGEMDFVLGQIRGLKGGAQAGLEEGALAAVIAAHGGETFEIPAERLLLFFGLAGKMGPLADWGLKMEGHRFVVDPATFQTSCAGLYAIGDACAYPGKLNLILSGFHEAALMAHHAVSRARPEEAHTFMHSTSMALLRDRLG